VGRARCGAAMPGGALWARVRPSAPCQPKWHAACDGAALGHPEPFVPVALLPCRGGQLGRKMVHGHLAGNEPPCCWRTPRQVSDLPGNSALAVAAQPSFHCPLWAVRCCREMWHTVCGNLNLPLSVRVRKRFMVRQRHGSPDNKQGQPPESEPTQPLPALGTLPQPGEAVSRQEPGLVDPRHFSPAPGDPSPGVGTPLDVEPLSGPTEASDDVPAPAEPDHGGLTDPRFLTPGPGDPATPESGG
jgi:hypothetical protein